MPRSPGRAAEPALIAAAAGATLLAWAWLWPMGMGASAPSMSMSMAWSAAHAVFTFLMWIVMMVAMMAVPVTPALSLYAGMQRTRAGGGVRGAVAMFAAGYAIVWIGFSAAATVVHWLLDRAGMLGPDMALASPRLGGAVLVAAGLYTFTPLAARCLRHCQSPLGFFMTHWRDGAAGALRMGVRHGLYCVGCCWALMAILFAVGVMNLAWVALLTLIVLLEKLSAPSSWLPRFAGGALALVGVAMMVSAA